MTNSTILITGGTSGIGLELARAFHARGDEVIVTGRRADLLARIEADHPGIATYVHDIADADGIAPFAGRLVADHPGLDTVILNAGIMQAETLSAQPSDLAVAEATITTNLLGPIRLTHALLPHLAALPRARIVTVTSGLAFVPLAMTPTYSATKAALHSWSQSLRWQLRGTGVKVSELAPPSVQTDLMPGHSKNPHAMPLDEFVDEVMAMLTADKVPDEILVERVKSLRLAERNGGYAERFDLLNGQLR
jgi:uncharacterized oxidoreductase